MSDASPPAGSTSPSVAAWLSVSFLAGAGVMLFELTAPRLMQPFFGASLFVWTNVIGVLLFAIAAGYHLGGRLAERPDRARRIGWLLVVASGFGVALPFLVKPLALWLLPEPGTLAQAASARTQLELGSLVIAAALFAPPVFLLACISPQVVRELVDAGRSVGRAAGAASMFGTLGSLLGTFLPTYVLVPLWGSRQSLFCAAAILLVPGLFLLLRRARGMSVLGLAVLGLGFLAAGPLRPAVGDERIVREEESRYQYLKVVRAPALGEGLEGRKELLLRINEGATEFHSVLTEGVETTGGKYYDTFTLVPALFPADRELSVLVLGSGAGTMARLLTHHWTERVKEVVNVEIDPDVVALEAEFGLSSDRVTTVEMDGRAFLRATRETYDVVFVDAYARQIDVPFHMATIEFFREVRARVRPGGLVALNVSGTDEGEPLVQAMARSLRDSGWGAVRSTPVRYWGNLMMWAARDGDSLGFSVADVPASLAPVLAHARRFTHDVGIRADAPELVDAHAPVEHLTDRWLRGDD